jgi:hypothetical protein
MIQRRFPRLAVLALCAALTAALSATAVQAAEPAAPLPARGPLVSLVDTAPPGGFFGYWGFDVFAEQSVGARFTVPAEADHRLVRVGIWFMNNTDTRQGKLRLSLQTDALDEGGTETLPSGRKLATWVAPVEALGWNPVEQFFSGLRNKLPTLKAGRHYWVVAESASPALVNPVWTTSSEGSMVTTTTANGAWQTAGEGAALTLQVDAVPAAR